ncbi:peptidoglycan-binding protein [Dyella sp. 333MFSha]|uniref:peptidoglycan-binding domain-containing protein n=1 Tax=Dyella sp. 333MFSha TaxID=1798240 RepID=UPI00088B9202|nr:peptidoglycan-binding protein [Dyella sp. 333MFSha]SDG31798.1 Putative peptidoglycan binding domain-containing protein [Dyella sp. 333MFSha]
MSNQSAWTLGQTSSYFESGVAGPGTISGGAGDHGGVSYGTYQLSSAVGTATEYVNWSAYKSQFEGRVPATEAFDEVWSRLARDEPAFGTSQHDFIKTTHYDPQMTRLANAGLDLSSRGPAVQDMVWSMSVQYRGNTTGIIDRGLRERFGDGYDLGQVSDKDLIEATHDTKLRHVNQDFHRSSGRIQQNLEFRMQAEKEALVKFDSTGVPATQAEIGQLEREARPLKVGGSGDRVNDLQTKLAELGYLTNDGRAIVPDGHFGRATKEALESFQRAAGRPVTGAASPQDLVAVNDQIVARGRATTYQARSSESQRLDSPAHPDNGFYLRTRDQVHRLDRDCGRVPDQRSDNLACALTVEARAQGLSRIDSLAFNEDASRLWAGQGLGGQLSGHTMQHASVDTVSAVNTPVELSSAAWPAAMLQFQQHQDRAQQQQQQQQIRQDVLDGQPHQAPAMNLQR